MKNMSLKTLLIVASFLVYGATSHAGGGDSFGSECTKNLMPHWTPVSGMRTGDTQFAHLNHLQFGFSAQMLLNSCAVFQFKVHILDQNGRVVRSLDDVSQEFANATYSMVLLPVTVRQIDFRGQVLKTDTRSILTIGWGYFMNLEPKAVFLELEIDGFETLVLEL